MLTQNIGNKKCSPCYKCEDREAGCHAKCERYAEWKGVYEIEKEAARTMRDNERMNPRVLIMHTWRHNKIVKERKR